MKNIKNLLLLLNLSFLALSLQANDKAVCPNYYDSEYCNVAFNSAGDLIISTIYTEFEGDDECIESMKFNFYSRVTNEFVTIVEFKHNPKEVYYENVIKQIKSTYRIGYKKDLFRFDVINKTEHIGYNPDYYPVEIIAKSVYLGNGKNRLELTIPRASAELLISQLGYSRSKTNIISYSVDIDWKEYDTNYYNEILRATGYRVSLLAQSTDVNKNGCHDRDEAALLKMLRLNKDNTFNGDLANCSKWTGVEWDHSTLKRITKLDISNLNVEDISSLYDLKYLKELNCSHNLISELDLSKFTGLVKLNFSYNDILKFDLSQCPLLKEIDCSYNIGYYIKDCITSLNCESNKDIEVIKCNGLRLKTIHLRSLSKLKILDCSHNKNFNILNIYASGCDLLEEINLNHLVSYEIFLKGADNIRKLDLSATSFTTIGRNYDSIGLSEYKNLIEVNLQKARYDYLTISNNKSLSKLNISDVIAKRKTEISNCNSLLDVKFTNTSFLSFSLFECSKLNNLVISTSYSSQIADILVKNCSLLSNIDISAPVEDLVLYNLPLYNNFKFENKNTSVYNRGTLSYITKKNKDFLKTINVARTAIDTLNIPNCSSLKMVNVDSCKSLRYLDCSYAGSSLMSIDISSCDNIIYLNCENSTKMASWVNTRPVGNLPRINASGCKYLKTLKCHGNSLGKIDLSGCSSLVNFDATSNILMCGFSKLDLTGCSSLKELILYNTHIDSLDVSSCTELRKIIVNGFRKETPGYLRYIKADCNALESITCRYNRLKLSNLNEIKENNPSVEMVPATQTRVTDDVYTYYGKAIDLTAENNFNGRASSFKWFKEGVVIDGANSASYTPTEKGLYHCEYTNSALPYSYSETAKFITGKYKVRGDIVLSNSEIKEDSPVGSIIGSFPVDVFEGDALSFFINENENFKIVGNKLISKSTFDFENKKEYPITIKVSDQNGLKTEKELIVTVLDGTDRPEDILVNSNLISQNSLIGSQIAVLSTVDPDENDVFRYTIAVNPYFEISDNKLILKSKVGMIEGVQYIVNVTTYDKTDLPFSKEIAFYYKTSPDLNADGFYDKDVEALKQIQRENRQSNFNWVSDDYGKWLHIVWSGNPKRVQGVNFNSLNIKVLNLSPFDSLEYLNCSGNQLKQLDVAVNVKLKSIHCSVNQLSEINIKGLSDLTEFYCNDNQIETITTEDNTSLSVVNCMRNKLTFSQLAKFDNLTSFSYKEQSPYNKTLYVFKNTELDYSNESNINGIPTAYKWYKNNTFIDNQTASNFILDEISWYYCKMTNDLFPALEITTENVYVRSDLELSTYNIPENLNKDKAIAQIIIENKSNDDIIKFNIDDNIKFEIKEDSIIVKTVFDFEIRNSYPITLTATDSKGDFRVYGYDIKINDINEAPTEISLSNNIWIENAPVGTLIGTLTAEDPDVNQTFIFSTIQPEFEIVGNEIFIKKPLNRESYSENTAGMETDIVVKDQNGLVFNKVFTMIFKDINEAPTAIQLSNATIAENSTIGTELGTLTASDEDANQTFIYTIAENENFDIAGDKLISKVEFDYEAQNAYSVEITVTDQDGLNHKQDFAIQINNVNEAPTAIQLLNATIVENTEVGTEVGSLTASDVDTNQTFIYTIAENDNFEIVGDKLINKVEFDYEAQNAYSVEITVTDQDGLNHKQDFAIQINNVNETPTAIQLSNATIAENAVVGTEVGSLTASDVDANQMFIYTIAENENFEISGDKLVSKLSFDYETKESYIVEITVTDQDGLSFKESFSIQIINVNEIPTAIQLSNTAIAENSEVGTEVGTLSASNMDANQTFTYTISENDSFEIAGDKLILKAVFDYESRDRYSIELTVTDQDGLSFKQSFAIKISNVNEIPTAIQLSNTTIAENAEVGTLVGTLSANDGDANQIFTYTIAENENFEIVGDKLVNKLAFDYESRDRYSIELTVIDQDGLSFKQSFAIQINNVNETPTAIQLSNATIAENAVVGTEVGSLTASDVDANQTFIYTIAENENFEISGDVLVSKLSFDYETKESYTVEITVTDQDGLNHKQDFAIQINNVNEIPTAIQLSNTTIVENAEVGTEVGTLSASDEDANQSFTYSIVENANFVLVGDELISKAAFDYETKESYTVEITVADQDGLSFKQSFAIQISDVNEASTAIQLSNATITENAEIGTLVGTLSANDEEANQSFTFTIAENDSFEIVGDKLVNKLAFDYESRDRYSIELTVTDQDGLSFEEMLTIQIEDVNEAPKFTSEPVLEARVGERFTYTLKYRDVDASGCTVTAVEIPSWLSFTDNEDRTATLSGIPTEAGTFNVILEASDNEYTARQEFEIEVQTVTGIEDVFSETTVQIYPNPVVNELYINLSDFANHEFSIALYHMNGSQIFKEQHQSIVGEARISKSVQHLRSGVYLLVIELEGYRESYKIVKQ